ncbi:GM20398 [Drosophila sechellia]|uniref:Hexosyltransferase n=1 Tax=Drosophila sechellia TaxID=7238 RepID=B4HNV7_DROSE|nr:GM20398 [Drosophila sechellia]
MQHNDIIQENFIDIYHNLTLKSYNPAVQGEVAMESLKRQQMSDVRSQVLQHEDRRRSPWYMPQFMFKGAKYRKYPSGTGYLMSIDLVRRLYGKPSPHLLSIWRMSSSLASVRRKLESGDVIKHFLTMIT